MEPFRIEPALPVGAVKTYSVVAPLATHWRDATCEEAGCPHFEHGWKTVIDETTDLGRAQGEYLRRRSGRRYSNVFTEGGLTTFIFEAGQRCFTAHKVQLERDPLLLVRPGDWRGYGPARVHQRPEDWIEDMSQTLDRIRSRQERG